VLVKVRFAQPWVTVNCRRGPLVMAQLWPKIIMITEDMVHGRRGGRAPIDGGAQGSVCRRCGAVGSTHNLPFSEWGTAIPDPRLVAAIVDRVTFNAHILETGTDSYRLRTTKTRTRRKTA
jgi:hypothetical protein